MNKLPAITELKSIPHWVGHKNKIPKNAHNGKNAQSNNPNTWASVEAAWQSVKRYGWDGLGWVFTIENGIVGVDLDDCFQENGRLKEWARDVVECLGSYTEYSPSGKGLHIYARGEIEGSINKSQTGFEMYNELRYFTVTGKQYGPAPYLHIEERPNELAALWVVFADDHEPQMPRPASNLPHDAKQITEAIKHIPNQMDYYDWLKVLMAVHDAMPGSDGVSIVESWSPGYKGEVARKFRSFDRTSKNGVTIATLFHMAKQHGYNSPKRERSYQPKQSYSDKLARLAAA